MMEPIAEPETGETGIVTTDAQWPLPPRKVAPVWHTVLMMVLIAGVSLMSGWQAKAGRMGSHHRMQYATTLAWEWMLAALVWWGLRMQHVPLRQLLHAPPRGAQETQASHALLKDAGAAFVFWLMSMLVLAALATVLRLLHLMSAQKLIASLAPVGAGEIALWILLCVSAGIAEELLFRGYFLQQFARLGGRVATGVVVSSLLFGVAHGYEGAGGMIAITAYGAMFGVFAVKRRSLRAGMMAHAWHDAVTGLALTLAKHLHAL
ncbi:CPBP family intramembrane glutamic endopeptidase [Silvibacterium dinghuense]|nr:CPBP family intramembrane glutamic endopeptidase [Silvibacterium dinghuense]GGH15300.1 hypothetical protein GCM10011586_36290 [Silvibacterium dinghuense]